MAGTLRKGKRGLKARCRVAADRQAADSVDRKDGGAEGGEEQLPSVGDGERVAAGLYR